MTLREQASERLTGDVFDDIDLACWKDDTEAMRTIVLDALQPLFDQVEREREKHDYYWEMWQQERSALLTECDDLRAKLTQAEAHIDKLVDVAHGLADQQAMKDDSWIPDVRAAIVWRAALDR